MTVTALAAPGPDDPHDPTTEGSTMDTPIVMRKSGDDDQEPARTDLDEVAEDENGQPLVPVDSPTDVVGARVTEGSHAEGLLPWQRREIARHSIIAPWLTRTVDVRAAARWALGWAWHVTGFHAIRAPLYGAKLLRWSLRGAWVALRAGARWVNDSEAATLRTAAGAGKEYDTYLKLTADRAQRVATRRRAAFVATMLTGATVVAALMWLPALYLWTAALVLALVLGKVGTPVDRPITGASVVRTRVERLTSEVVIRSLAALGISGINQAMSKGGQGITFPAPITRDGPGWRADVDLPHGVTAVDVIERRDRLASGLRRPMGCVWPEPNQAEHAGRLVLWVGDNDLATSKPVAWPLAKRGTVDLHRPVPFGVDQRGRSVDILMMFESVLIGSKPRMGKTFAMRVLILAAALDAGAQLRVFELKGTGDLSMVEHCCHRYGSGADPATLEACMDTLREVYAELDTRAATIRRLPRERCPENKVTPQLSARRELKLHTQVIGIDERQELFSHPDHKDEAARLAEAIIKRGPALGIILILATQRPDAKSMPTGVSANIGIRFCLRVMGQVENDMVLGTSSYQQGLRATMFTAKDKGIGYLVGAGDDAQIVRTAYIDGPAAEAIGARARALREAAGTITGHAAGEVDETTETTARRSILADMAAVFGPDEDRLWSEVIATRLTAQWPDIYAKATPATLAAGLKPYGLKPGQVWGTDPETGDGANRRGYLREAIVTTWLATRTDRTVEPDAPEGHAA
ncbi:FtsK/SpoIIIE domain-containing protein [Pseudonocardia sp. ICBG1142]|uniref:FtsK/SpoIIIE domain-containing protein n=1 Tax=Pseudonocardia sp. ICBG1142 TaxID=2846760 RepID=UPI001CF6E4E8|nr:FtsK/SpoIIIE domain-containing protein [Pseudonocardia sp. ICBG1142]